MPIYAYRCKKCGCEKEVLQKISDPALVTCPECGADQMSKMVTAAGFQLKGSGWYVTDFRDNGNNKAAQDKSKESDNKNAQEVSDKNAGQKAEPEKSSATNKAGVGNTQKESSKTETSSSKETTKTAQTKPVSPVK